MRNLLGKPLAWLASFGAAFISTGLVWLFSIWLHPSGTAYVLIVAISAKIAGALVAAYGPKPKRKRKVLTPEERAERKARLMEFSRTPKSVRSEPGGDLHHPRP